MSCFYWFWGQSHITLVCLWQSPPIGSNELWACVNQHLLSFLWELYCHYTLYCMLALFEYILHLHLHMGNSWLCTHVLLYVYLYVSTYIRWTNQTTIYTLAPHYSYLLSPLTAGQVRFYLPLGVLLYLCVYISVLILSLVLCYYISSWLCQCLIKWLTLGLVWFWFHYQQTIVCDHSSIWLYYYTTLGCHCCHNLSP